MITTFGIYCHLVLLRYENAEFKIQFSKGIGGPIPPPGTIYTSGFGRNLVFPKSECPRKQVKRDLSAAPIHPFLKFPLFPCSAEYRKQPKNHERMEDDSKSPADASKDDPKEIRAHFDV